ncbi:dihydropteroate synthase [Nitrosomonas sp. Nm33]|uniref:dihydropteroate synthase n=2 Tax=Nitrosomonas sp. Nm33 TaxID=133724 RepID=UPI000894F5D2|nr:dihydropteroate synthase [Nitrosomonas sp. Nm33]SDX94720.1 dihydropteroate synthase [Nitrosomonas sp. Nm33]
MNQLQQLKLNDGPYVMGIINVTPDSFSDHGLYATTDKALELAERLIQEGADILDIGGESTRPGSLGVSLEEELRRVIPVVEILSQKNIPISVDTSKPEVMQAAISAGASIINDVNALQAPGAIEIVAKSRAIICLMHMQGKPRSMQESPYYVDVVSEVKSFLQHRIDIAVSGGIPYHRLIIDPGFGFGKTLKHNLELLRNLDQFVQMNVPILAGLSRKSMLGAITGNDVDNRVHASVAAALFAVTKGAKILRVHDVKATKDTIMVHNALITRNNEGN